MLPLERSTVLDLTRVLAGPNATQILADFGARIWKVEALNGDEARTWGASGFAQVNRGKQSLAINIADPRGQKIVQELAKKADIFTENYKVGNLERFGLHPDALMQLNPRLICASITGFGQTGPRNRNAGYDMVAQAYSGMMSMTGEPNGGPLRIGVPLVDLMTGMYAALGVVLAVLYREHTGAGQKIDVSLYDVAVASLGGSGGAYLDFGHLPKRHGADHSSFAPCQLYETSDGPVMIAVGNNLQFCRLCEAIGLPEIADDARFATNALRVENKAALNTILFREFAKWRKLDLVAKLEGTAVPSGPIYDLTQVFTDPQAISREVVQEAPEGGLRVMASPLRFMSQSAPMKLSEVPEVGEHTFDILRQELMISEAEIKSLAEERVIGNLASGAC